MKLVCGRADGSQEHTEADQNQRPIKCVSGQLKPGMSLGEAGGERKRKRYAHNEGEGRLNQIVQGATDPRHVRLVIAQEAPETAPGKRLGNTTEAQHLRHHQKHHEAAVDVERRQPGGQCGTLDLRDARARLHAIQNLDRGHTNV